MKEMATWLGVAVVLACLVATPAAAQRMGPSAVFDLDSLTCAGTDIVEGTLAGAGMAGGGKIGRAPIRVINFEITVVHKGALQPGQVIPVAFADNYMKNTRGFRQPLEYGAKLILFLTKGPSLLTLDNGWERTIHGTLLPRMPYGNEYYWIAPSGMRWIDEDGVKSFYSSSGGALYELLDRDREKPKRRFPSLKEFRLDLADSIRKTKGLADCLYFCPEPPSTQWMLELLRERAQDMDPRMKDIIVPLMAKRMIKAHDLETLDAALLIPLPDGSFPFSPGFATPEGREYLCNRLDNAQTPPEKKLRYAQSLLGAAPIFEQRMGAGEEARAAEFRRTIFQEYLSLLARQARNQAKDEAVSLQLVAGLHRMEWYLAGKKQEANAHLKSELAALRELYFTSGSEAVKYEVERIMAKADRVSYDQLESRCHSIISTIKPGSIAFSGPPVQDGKFIYACEFTVLDSVAVDKAWIVLDNLNTRRTYVLPLSDVSSFKKPGESNFSTSTALPEDFERGKYRGHLEFEKEGEVISVGHGFEAEL